MEAALDKIDCLYESLNVHMCTFVIDDNKKRTVLYDSLAQKDYPVQTRMHLMTTTEFRQRISSILSDSSTTPWCKNLLVLCWSVEEFTALVEYPHNFMEQCLEMNSEGKTRWNPVVVCL